MTAIISNSENLTVLHSRNNVDTSLFKGIAAGPDVQEFIRGAAVHDATSDVLGVFRASSFAVESGSPYSAALGFASCVTAPVSMYKMQHANTERLAAHHIGDVEGRRIAVAKMVKNIFTAEGATTLFAARTTTILANGQGDAIATNSATSLGRTAFWTNFIAWSLIGIGYIVSAGQSLYKMGKTIIWLVKLESAFLTEKTEKVALRNIQPSGQLCQETGLEQLSLWLEKIGAELKKEGLLKNGDLSSAQRKTIARRIFAENALLIQKEAIVCFGATFWNEVLMRSGGNIQEAFGLALQLQFANEVKRQELTRMLGTDLAKELSGQPISQEKLKEVRLTLYKQLGLELFNLLLSLAGLAMIILDFIPKAACGLAAAIIWGVTAIIGCFIDGKAMIEWLNQGEVGKAEKGLVIISLILAAISVISIISFSLVFGGPLWVVLVALILNGFWILMNSIALVKLYRHDLMHPTIDSLHNRLSKKIGAKGAGELFLKLAKDEQMSMLAADFNTRIKLQRLQKSVSQIQSKDLEKIVKNLSEGQIERLVREHRVAQKKANRLRLVAIQKTLQLC